MVQSATRKSVILNFQKKILCMDQSHHLVLETIKIITSGNIKVNNNDDYK